MLEQLRDAAGFDAAALAAAHETAPPVSVRRHPQKAGELFRELPAVPWCSEGRYLSSRPVFTLDPLFHAGAYYVQEASSMFLDYLLRQLFEGQRNLRALDLCGAPGGKSTLLASALHESCLVICNEVIRSRATILEENMVRWGLMNAWVSSNDARDFGRLPGYFDLVVVDAPCSGSGLFRKEPEWRAGWSEEQVKLCSARQQRILADAWPALKEGGVLIYATCSYSPEEDEQLLDWLADTFSVEGILFAPPEEWGIVAAASPRHRLPCFRFYPDKVQGEGFFIAALRKRETTSTFLYPRFRSAHQKKAAEASAQLLRGKQFVVVEDDRREFRALQPQHEPDWQLLQNVVYLRKAGTGLGAPAQKEWIPAHDVALSVDASPELPRLEVDLDSALRFLKKEDIPVPSGLRGWQVLSYEGRGLGWIKALSNRSNNYLPKHWRIRMELPAQDSGPNE